MIIFNPPPREFIKGELIVANPETPTPIGFLDCLAVSDGSKPFIANGIACSYGEPNPVDFRGTRYHGIYKHADYILADNFISGVKYLHEFLDQNPEFFINSMVDDGTINMLVRCNRIIERAFQWVDRDSHLSSPHWDKIQEISQLSSFNVNLYMEQLSGAPQAFPDITGDTNTIPMRLYLAIPEEYKDLLKP